jgi:RNA recognition motif-containing protein
MSTSSFYERRLLKTIVIREQDKEATVYIGNLDERVTDSLVWELMLQAGRIVNVHLPKDRVTQAHQGYGFVEFISEEDAEYAARVMNQVRLYGKPIRVNKASADKQKTVEVGAELFVGNLDPMVTEQVLYETFSRFGTLLSLPKVRKIENSHCVLPHRSKYFTDCKRRSEFVEGLRVRVLRGLRFIRCCHRQHERAISHEQRNFGPICLQEGRQRRKTWRRGGTNARGAGSQTQRSTPGSASPPSAHSTRCSHGSWGYD